MRNLILGVVFVSIAASTAGAANDIMTVELVSVAGSGCNKDQFAVALAADHTAFTVSYSSYTAMSGPGHSLLEARKNCVLDIRIRVPNGFTYGIAAADMRGYAYLAPNVDASARLSFWFQGSPQTAFVTHDIRSSGVSCGPVDDNDVFDDDWQTSDATGIASIVWASCSAKRNLNVNTQLRLSAPANTGESLVSMDTTDGSITTVFHVSLMPCP